jgi:predicted transcriptional regulator YheO
MMKKNSMEAARLALINSNEPDIPLFWVLFNTWVIVDALYPGSDDALPYLMRARQTIEQFVAQVERAGDMNSKSMQKTIKVLAQQLEKRARKRVESLEDWERGQITNHFAIIHKKLYEKGIDF